MKIMHGSEDSLDKDVFYVVENMPSFQDCQKFCSDKQENRNVVTIENGIVSACYKGTIDEVNNGIYHTYGLHPQEFENPVKRLVERDALIKSARAVRCLLSHLSRTGCRAAVKEALRSASWQTRVAALRQINLDEIQDFGKNGSPLDVKKTFAFQIAQTLALLNGVEVYTKRAAVQAYPSLRAHLYRENAGNINLSRAIAMFTEKMASFRAQEKSEFVVFEDFARKLDLKTEKYV